MHEQSEQQKQQQQFARCSGELEKKDVEAGWLDARASFGGRLASLQRLR